MGEVLGSLAPAGGLIGTLITVFFLVYKGKLIPGSWVETLLAQAAVRQAQTEADRDHWRQVAETSVAQVNELLTTTRVTAQVLQSLPPHLVEPEEGP